MLSVFKHHAAFHRRKNKEKKHLYNILSLYNMFVLWQTQEKY